MSIQKALLVVTSTLLGRVWVEYGDNRLPGHMIWESNNDNCIQVIPTGKKPGEYEISMSINNTRITIIYDEALRNTESEGISMSDFRGATEDDCRSAAGLVMLYYKTAMQA